MAKRIRRSSEQTVERSPVDDNVEPRPARVRVPRLPSDPLHVVAAKTEQSTPDSVTVSSAVEDPHYPSHFAVVNVDVRSPTVPLVTEGDVPFIDPKSLDVLTTDRLSELEEKAFATVPLHRRCPVCWGNLKGKAQRRQVWWKRVSGVTVKICYQCDCCGHRWIAKVRTQTTIVHDDASLEVERQAKVEAIQ